MVAEPLDFDFCLSTSTRFDNEHIRSCLASRRSVSGWGLVTHGPWPSSPMTDGLRRGATSTTRWSVATTLIQSSRTARAQNLSAAASPLPFDTPEGAWPLSQTTWVQRWRRGRGAVPRSTMVTNLIVDISSMGTALEPQPNQRISRRTCLTESSWSPFDSNSAKARIFSTITTRLRCTTQASGGGCEL